MEDCGRCMSWICVTTQTVDQNNIGLPAVLRIHDILGWIRIRIRGSMPLINGSGSESWILLFSPSTFNTIFSAYYFLKVRLHHFLKIKSQKESPNSRNQGFSYYFCMMIEGSGSGSRAGSGSIPLTSGSGSGRPKNMWIRWIRIRTRNTGSQSNWLCEYFFTDTGQNPCRFGSVFSIFYLFDSAISANFFFATVIHLWKIQKCS
jgi:hypothetical protein